MPGTTGNIVWSRTDPKTWELHNLPYDEPPPTGTVASDQEAVAGELVGRMFEESQARSGFAPAEPAQVAQRQFWRRQLHNFDETLRRGDPQRRTDDMIDGIQEMLDTGAITMDEEGNVSTAVPGVRGKAGNQRLLDAARTYNDWFKDQLAYGEDVTRPGARQMVEATKANEQIDPEAYLRLMSQRQP